MLQDSRDLQVSCGSLWTEWSSTCDENRCGDDIRTRTRFDRFGKAIRDQQNCGWDWDKISSCITFKLLLKSSMWKLRRTKWKRAVWSVRKKRILHQIGNEKFHERKLSNKLLCFYRRFDFLIKRFACNQQWLSTVHSRLMIEKNSHM